MTERLSPTVPSPLGGACGLYCGACYHYRAGQPEGEHLLREAAIAGRLRAGYTCQGCWSHQLYLHPGCAQCALRACAQARGLAHCGACPDLPCERLLALQNDGRPHHRDVVQQARAWRALGPARWEEGQRQRWRCASCGAAYSWYETSCARCGWALPSYGPDPSIARTDSVETRDRARGSRAVLFDFDFTLADASAGIVECINYALQAMGLETATPEIILPTVGLSLRDTLIALRGPEQASRFDEFHDLFVQRADLVMTHSTRLYASTASTLRALGAQGLKVGICTNKYRYRIIEVLEREGLRDAVHVIVGCEDVVELKPHPEGLWRAAEALGMAMADTLYVGDSATDAEAAQRAGAPFVAVHSALTPPDALAPFPLLAVLPEVGALLPWLQERGWLDHRTG